jgi:hypothetical protein
MKMYTYFVLALSMSISVYASNKEQAVNRIKQQLNVDSDVGLICIEISRN